MVPLGRARLPLRYGMIIMTRRDGGSAKAVCLLNKGGVIETLTGLGSSLSQKESVGRRLTCCQAALAYDLNGRRSLRLAVFLCFGRYGTRLLCDLVDVTRATLPRQFDQGMASYLHRSPE